ncbi:unnamed protein product, partial [Didymodactylos carnosus]
MECLILSLSKKSVLIKHSAGLKIHPQCVGKNNFIQIPFLESLLNLTKLPEVQQCLSEPHIPNPNVITDYRDAKYYQDILKNTNKQDLLSFEMACDDLTITNQISHHVHKLFLFYWTLLNLNCYQRSKQVVKRLLAVVPKTLMANTTIADVMSDFIDGLLIMWHQGIEIVINGTKKNFFGILLYTVADFPATNCCHGFKESTSALRFCRLCDVRKDNYFESLDKSSIRIIPEEYDRYCTQIELFNDPSQKNSKKEWQTLWGINSRSAFCRLPYFDVTRQVLYDPLHVFLEGVCKVELNAFLIFCHDSRRFDIAVFCSKVCSFPYLSNEKCSKQSLNVKIEDIKKSGSVPLDSAQLLYLFRYLPFMLAELLGKMHNSDIQILIECGNDDEEIILPSGSTLASARSTIIQQTKFQLSESCHFRLWCDKFKKYRNNLELVILKDLDKVEIIKPDVLLDRQITIPTITDLSYSHVASISTRPPLLDRFNNPYFYTQQPQNQQTNNEELSMYPDHFSYDVINDGRICQDENMKEVDCLSSPQ